MCVSQHFCVTRGEPITELLSVAWWRNIIAGLMSLCNNRIDLSMCSNPCQAPTRIRARQHKRLLQLQLCQKDTSS